MIKSRASDPKRRGENTPCAAKLNLAAGALGAEAWPAVSVPSRTASPPKICHPLHSVLLSQTAELFALEPTSPGSPNARLQTSPPRSCRGEGKPQSTAKER